MALILSLVLIISMAGCGKTAADTSEKATGNDVAVTTAADESSAAAAIQTATPAPTGAPVFVRDQSQAKLTVIEGKGEFDPLLGGADIPVGRYVITVDVAIAANVTGYIGNVLAINEAMGIVGYSPSNITADIVEGEEIFVDVGSVITFTPADTVVTTQLTAGSWIVGTDIPAGKYVCKIDLDGTSMSIMVYSADLMENIGEYQVGGNSSLPEVELAFEEGQIIFIERVGTLTCTLK